MKNNGMNSHLRRTFYLFVAGFVALVGVLAYWQVYAKDALATNPANRLQSQRVQEVPRGLILAGDGETELARSEENGDGTYGRVYPEGPVYAGVTGYWSPKYGASGIEIGQNNNLSGAGEPETLDELINQFQGDQRAGNDVTLTLDPELQRLAYDQLSESSTGRGAVVALNPKNGEILSLASYPSFDPNKIDEDFEDLTKDEDFPLVNRATQGLYPPGSTFKVITAGAALEAGVKPSDKYKDSGTYETPGYTVYNYRAKVYGEQTFQQALANSVNTIFAKVAYDDVGADLLSRTATDFGYYDTYEDFPLPVSPSVLGPPPDQWAQGNIAQIAFGQQSVQSNVFEMALVAGTVANGGTMMDPRLVREVRTPDGVVIDKPTPRVRHRALDGSTASTLNDMMQHAVTDVESGAEIPGVKVAGKTGTAEASVNGRQELHSWFISFAPADDPEIAVAVLIEDGQEGYKSALPIARRLMETHLRNTGTLSQDNEISSQPAQQTSSKPQNESTTPAQTQSESTTPAQTQSSAPAQPKSGGGPFQFPFQNPFQGSPQGSPQDPKSDPAKADPSKTAAPGKGPSG